MDALAASLAEHLPAGLLIDGGWVHESTGGVLSHVNPATGKVQKVFPIAGVAEIDAAVTAARRALPQWRRMAGAARRTLLMRLADLIAARADAFGALGTLENGVIRAFTSGGAQMAAEWFRYYAGWSDKAMGEASSSAVDLTYTSLEPIGVVAIILTWNGPTGSIGMKVAAALAAGCCVVLKPPELAPFTSNLFGELCLEAGVPPGVINIVVGGSEAGEALVRHPGIDKISFTGGAETARRIQIACAAAHTPLVLELGGKSANIVFADADLDAASAAAAQGIASLNGQLCVAPSRLLVDDSIYGTFVERVVSHLGALPVGNPFDPATFVGPVISARACDRILGMIDQARAAGEGKLLLGGSRLPLEGFFVQPTVFGDVSNSASIAREEVFGPVLSIIRFSSEDEAVAIANDSPLGLAAYVQTANLTRAHRIAAQLDVGMVSVNRGALGQPHTVFGGFKDSGYGKEGGLAGLMEYMRVKQVSIGLS